jgi:hypothetical protein
MSRAMTPCARESDVLDLIGIGQWPARADADLAAHVASCPSCTDLALVASAIVDVRDTGTAYKRLPDAGIVWLRAQMRAREDAARRAARPLWMAQVAGVAAVIAILVIWSGGLMGSLSAFASSGWAAITEMFARQPTLMADASPASAGTAAQAGGTWLIPALIGGTFAVVMLAFGVSKLADDERGL